ncbi:MAG: hypothetical protein CM15mV48_180 [uncultured marine virus]|nr:MAG: hypothetical protein CM15mV48_180 [uncultured marine virus]
MMQFQLILFFPQDPDSGSDKLQVHAGQLALSNYFAGAIWSNL